MNIKFDIFNEITWPQFKILNEVRNLSDQDKVKQYNVYLNQLNTARLQYLYNNQGGGTTTSTAVNVLPFEFTVNTANISTGSTTNTQFKLPLVSSLPLNAVVDWGDGTTDTITVWDQVQTTHTYSSSGIYTIKITGDLSGWQFNGTGDRLKILNIASWGALNISVASGFYACTNLTSTATDAPTITTTSLANYFRDCLNFNGAIGKWNVFSVTDMTSMFLQALVFNNGGSNDINNWNVSNVTNMANMFENARAFNQPIGNWNTSAVTNMSSMFRTTLAFNQPIGSWNTSAVTNMLSMFRDAAAFNQNIGNWNISNVTSIGSFMAGKTSANFSAANLDAIYNGWSSRPVQASRSISFNTIKYTAAGQAGRNILTGAPNLWTITDGGI